MVSRSLKVVDSFFISIFSCHENWVGEGKEKIYRSKINIVSCLEVGECGIDIVFQNQ